MGEVIIGAICAMPQTLELIIWGILMIIFGVINGVASTYIVGIIWAWPIFILSGIALILHNLISMILFPLCIIFPPLYTMPNMFLAFLNNASMAGLLPFLPAIVSGVLAIIVAIPNAILHIILLFGCNSNGIALFSKISQTILSWLSA